MTEQETKAFPIGSVVKLSNGTEEKVGGYDCYTTIKGGVDWEVVTEDVNGARSYWVNKNSLTIVCMPPSSFPEHQCAQYDINTDTMKPAEPPRPLCPVEGETADSIDWDAHRRFMRGLG